VSRKWAIALPATKPLSKCRLTKLLGAIARRGVLTEILARRGDTVETGSRVAVIDDSGTAPTPTWRRELMTPNGATDRYRRTVPVPATGPWTVGRLCERRGRVARRGDESSVTAASKRQTLQGTGRGIDTRRDAERAVLDGPTQEVVGGALQRSSAHGSAHAVSAQVTPHGFVRIEATVPSSPSRPWSHARDGISIPMKCSSASLRLRALGEFEFLNATFGNDELGGAPFGISASSSVDDDGNLVPVVPRPPV